MLGGEGIHPFLDVTLLKGPVMATPLPQTNMYKSSAFSSSGLSPPNWVIFRFRPDDCCRRVEFNLDRLPPSTRTAAASSTPLSLCAEPLLRAQRLSLSALHLSLSDHRPSNSVAL